MTLSDWGTLIGAIIGAFLTGWYINRRSERQYKYLDQYQSTSVYQVHNKVFSIYFWTIEDANNFMKTHSSGSNGLTVSKIDIFGTKPR